MPLNGIYNLSGNSNSYESHKMLLIFCLFYLFSPNWEPKWILSGDNWGWRNGISCLTGYCAPASNMSTDIPSNDKNPNYGFHEQWVRKMWDIWFSTLSKFNHLDCLLKKMHPCELLKPKPDTHIYERRYLISATSTTKTWQIRLPS